MNDDYRSGYTKAILDVMDFLDRYGETLVSCKWFGKKDIKRIKQILQEFHDKCSDFIDRPQDIVWYKTYLKNTGVLKAKLRRVRKEK